MIARALKAGLLGVVSLALIAAQDPSQTAPEDIEPPPFFAERIDNGRVELGQFEYLRGYFPEASEDEKEQYAALIAWLDACEQKGKARLDIELAELGVTLEGERLSLAGADNMCQQVVTGQSFEQFASYAQLAEATRGARLVFDTLVQSAQNAELRAGPSSPDDLGGFLRQRIMGEQLLRNAYSWGWSKVDEPRKPKMSADERTVFTALLTSEIVFVDYRNRTWLERFVEKHGWPKISKVGERGSHAAWLLTQHADMDPSFQLRALRLMKPLLADKEVSKRNYAYLYDRTTLSLNIKQRYGTQLRCEDGAWVLRPLEEPDRVDELRAEMDLEPLAEYLESFPPTCGS